ncbi:MAG: glycine betaine/L-proline ABC transporter ATP-binding protein [Kiritimatiellae bacterium]|jgi:glycine betaine/proline transport system ATP-binding protein|nr:glycine betaine/L-proline ABC transporter ATP-binding protein [Kiritimatiellia bacterium]MDD4342169.1 glycine betaine/L-proline ABC transporter ATP-binding protein [Kiritimatiellia bacterium]MDY0149533.1 glycine betaine/L-proline ABC transporter ATP-binding protein [Kiritimatiellia bacterium]
MDNESPPDAPDPLIEVRSLYKIFGSRLSEARRMLDAGRPRAEILKKTGGTPAVVNANFSIHRRETFVIMGLSGSGKSTLLRLLNRLIEPTHGEILVDGEDIAQLGRSALRELRRRKFAMVFQHFGLLPHRNVIENVAFGLEIQDVAADVCHKKAVEAIESVGLDGYEDSAISALSGGMQQRVGLARALATNPEILLMDEAFSALDPLIRTQMQDELADLQARLQKTVVFITHDLDEALKLGDRIAIMKDGVIDQIGTPEAILTEPATDYVRTFVENVDRSKVLTAGSVMKRTCVVASHKDGPHLAVRLMQQNNLSSLFVVGQDRRFLGMVNIDNALAEAKKGGRELGPIVQRDVPTVDEVTYLRDMIPVASETRIPIPVLRENGTMAGIVSRAVLLSALSSKNGDES